MGFFYYFDATKHHSLPHLKDISISKKLYFIVGAMAILIIIELFTLWFAIQTLSSVRALVGAEGLWSKAQKDAAYQLVKYYNSRKEKDYQAYQNFLVVPLGDHKTRLELIKKEPDMKVARQGFLEGRIHPNDIDGMINLLRRFNSNRYINKAIGYWTEGDSLIFELVAIGNNLHQEINSGAPSEVKLNSLIASLDPLNERLTLLEDNFSYVLGEGSRWLENIILKILFGVALTVEITGLILTISVSRNITKALNAINKATTKITEGDLSARATIYSKDEIGHVAMAVNKMTEQLLLSNKELEQFAFIASHDLQEPLRKIQTFADLILRDEPNLSPKSKEYFLRMQSSARRMKNLIEDLLDYSRTNISERKFEKVHLNQIVQDVVNELEQAIKEKQGLFKTGNLTEAFVNPSLFRQVIHNLLTNALRFSKPNVPPVITIHSEIANGSVLRQQNDALADLHPEKMYTHIEVRDNGIGFEPEFAKKVFEMFQRLHVKENPEGTGIGLTIVKKIVEHHNGLILAKGEVNKGARFDLYIPFH
jgi:two-component system, sensor histidine kinase